MMQSEKQPSDSRIDALPCAHGRHQHFERCSHSSGNISANISPLFPDAWSVGWLVRLRFANARTVMNCGFYEENSPVPNPYYTCMYSEKCVFSLSLSFFLRFETHTYAYFHTEWKSHRPNGNRDRRARIAQNARDNCKRN